MKSLFPLHFFFFIALMLRSIRWKLKLVDMGSYLLFLPLPSLGICHLALYTDKLVFLESSNSFCAADIWIWVLWFNMHKKCYLLETWSSGNFHRFICFQLFSVMLGAHLLVFIYLCQTLCYALLVCPGSVYTGVDFCKKLCGVSIVRR